jgi:peptide-methionine (S)-S-oxide reductase
MWAGSIARRSSMPTMQHEVAERYMDQIEREGVFDEPLATELVPLQAFYVAEDDHHDYAARNRHQPYIRAVAQPKIEAIQAYKEHRKEEAP